MVELRQSDRKYTDAPVENWKIERCIESARLSPSANNSQPWKFVVVDDPALKDAVADCAASMGMNKFAVQARAIVAVVMEKPGFMSSIGSVIQDKEYPLLDIGIAANQFCLQAADLGLGTCMIGWFNEKKVRKLLGVPKKKRIPLLITVGYPGAATRPKTRKLAEEISCLNGLNNTMPPGAYPGAFLPDTPSVLMKKCHLPAFFIKFAHTYQPVPMKRFAVLLILLCVSISEIAAQTGVDIEPYRETRASEKDSAFITRIRENPFDVEALINVCDMLMTQVDYPTVAIYARRLLEIGKKDNDDKARLYGALFLGKTMLFTPSQRDSVFHYFDIAVKLSKKLNDSAALSTTYNGLGIYAVDADMDYYRGLSYFRDALKAAGSKEENPTAYGIALNNTAMTYYLRNDPTGMKYAQEAYMLGHERGDEFQVFSGAFVSAYMCHLVGNDVKALEYINEALQYAERFNIHTELYSLYANIKLALGDTKTAEVYYRKALDHVHGTAANAMAMAYLSYGTYLMKQDKSQEAIPLLRKGIEISRERHNAAHRYMLYQRISEAYEDVGDFRNALHFHRIYHIESDSIFNIERERSVNELMIEYEAEKRENELQFNRIRLIQQQKKLHATLFILAIIFTALAVTYLLYYRKNKMYAQIVRQYHEFLTRERKLEDRISTILGAEPVEEQPVYANRNEELFDQLERLMKISYVYRDSDLNVEKLAEKLGTNRTYLSKAISQQTGGNFNAYLNAYRIDEAVRLLSDPDNETPLKAIAADLGFNSIQTFYAVFKGQVGLPPSKFREKYLQLYNKRAL